MQNILKKYCIEDNENGLVLIDMPTGSGKTYNVIDFIYNQYKTFNKKIFFITPLKKNLGYEDLKKKFLDEGKDEEFNKDVLYIKSNMDMLLENFNEAYKEISDKIRNDKTTKHIKTLIKIIQTKNLNPEFKTEAIENLREEWEPKFRSNLESYVIYNENGEKRNYEERLKFVEEENPWIIKLYPSVMTDKAKIIFMTVDKFLAMNSTIIKPSYTILSDDVVKGAIIFIDEFDSAKENILTNIIKSSLNNKIGMLDLFHMIYAGLTVCDFTKKLMTPSQYNVDKKKSSDNYYNPSEIIEKFKNRADDIKDKYNLQFLHKLVGNPKDDAYFLFQDYRFISILPSKNNYLLIKTNKIDRINQIEPVENKEEDRDELKDLLFDVKNFINYFQIGVGFIANNYKQLKIELKEDLNLISDDACVRTVLAEFGIEGKYLNYLTKAIVRRKKTREISSNSLSDDLDFSCNEKGFRYYSIIDSDTHDTQSKIDYVTVDETPEKILLGLCNKAKIVGISASSSLRTSTGNFDINYLEIKLGKKFKHLSKEERIELKEYFDRQTSGYDKVNISLDAIRVDELNLEKLISSFSEDVQKTIINKFENLKPYIKIRYIKLFLCMQAFVQDSQTYSFLFLTSKLLKENDPSFDFVFAKNVFNELCNQFNIIANIESLFGDVDTYDYKKKEIEKNLSNEERVFLVSSYQTLGAGQNIQYKIPNNFVKGLDYFSINDLDYQDNYKDFDAIYVDKPTNVFVNMNNEIIEEDQFIRYVYQVKVLEESGDISTEAAYRYIKEGFETYHGIKFNSFSTPANSKNLRLHTAKLIQQAMGRICRTRNKSKNIHIYYDNALLEELKGVKKHYKHVLLNPEFSKFLDQIEDSVDNSQSDLENRAEFINKSSKSYIKKLLNFKNDNIYKWENLRDQLLRYPTIDSPTETYSAYIELPSQNIKYSYDEENKRFGFNSVVGNIVGEGATNLRELLQIPRVRDFFIQKNYATSFIPNKYILSPEMFVSIYKGALGEVVGEFIFKEFLGIELEKIRDNERYEKFDFYKDKVFVDFKNFSGYKDFSRAVKVEDAKNKLRECGGGVALIVNILKPRGNPEIFVDNHEEVIIIPYLFDIERKQFNTKAIFEIQKLFNK